MIRAGGQIRVTTGRGAGELVTIWSPAPSPGTYWAHLGAEVVLVKVRAVKNAVHPIVTVEEEQA
jgi:hypothetical protein